MPLDDDEFRDEVLEIKDRIVEEHHRGGHVTGPVAGCAICAEQREMPAMREAANIRAIEDIARLRLTSAPPADVDGEPEHRINVGGEVSLIEVALADGENALTDAANGRTSIANVRATVGVIRAVAAIDETLRTILAAIVNQQIEAHDFDPDPGEDEVRETEILHAARMARAARMVRESAADEATDETEGAGGPTPGGEMADSSPWAPPPAV